MTAKSRGVSIAEKRAELLAAGEEWPVCGCHGEPRLWHKDARREAGGSWRCFVINRAASKRYGKTAKGRAADARYQKTDKYWRYRRSAEGRATQARHSARQIRIGRTYLGTTNQYPAPKEAVIAFARGLREESGLWPA